MRRRVLGLWLAGLLVVTSGPGLAQDDWELPSDLKQKQCPEGTVPDGHGFCLPAKDAPAPEPVPAPAPEPEPAPATTPAPEPTPARVPPPAADATDTAAPPAGADLPPEPEAQPTDPAAQPAPDDQRPPPPAESDQAAGTEGEAATKAEEPPPADFVKGELSAQLGTSKLMTKNNRVGVRLGWEQIDLVHYLTINPELDLRFDKLSFGLGVPLALEMFNGHLTDGQDWTEGFSGAGDFRTEDWDEWQEYARFIRYLTYGRKEDRLYFSLSQYGSNTLGHGTLMRRYSVNVDPDSTRVSGQFDMYNDYAGFEITTNSIVSWEVFGALAFVKPLAFFLDNPIARSLSLGFTYLADRDAPVLLTTRAADGASPALPFYLEGDARPAVANSAWLHAMGVDLEIKVLKTDHLDLKPYADFSWMMPQGPSGIEGIEPEGGNGFTLGLLGRFNFGSDPVHALRIIAEFRSFSSTFLPGYFDTFYEVHKYLLHQHYATTGPQACPGPLAQNEQRRCLPPTKFYDVFVNRKGGDRRLGFYAEFNYSIVDYLSLTLALEGSDAANGNHFLAHLEVPALDWFQFFVTFEQASMESLGDLFSKTVADKTIFAAARLRILPFLFINFRYFHTLMLREGAADLNADGLEDVYRAYEPHHAWMGDIEFGWEF